MIVVFEEKSEIKFALIIKTTPGHLLVENLSGKQAKIKDKAVLLNINQNNLQQVEDEYKHAQTLAENIDINFLYSCALDLYKQNQFNFVDFAREYFGKDALRENLSLLHILRTSPIYFRKNGEGVYKCAEEAQVQAALLGIAKRQEQEQKMQELIDKLKNKQIPDGWQNQWQSLLFKKDNNSLSAKALQHFAKMQNCQSAEILINAKIFNSWEDYHRENFIFNDYPDVVEISENFTPEYITQINQLINSLPISSNKALAFSIDDESTDEIDDALSVQELGNGYQIGIHIALPAILANFVEQNNCESEYLNRIKKRISTVYFPSSTNLTKIPMMGERSQNENLNSWCDIFSLDEDKVLPVVSLYFQITEGFEIIIESINTQIERKIISHNLRLQQIESEFNQLMLADEIHTSSAIPHFSALKILWQLAQKLEKTRAENGAIVGNNNVDFRFEIINTIPKITLRERGSPVDTLVAEMMIFANAHWAGLLRENNVPMIYRVKSGDKVGFSTVALPHTTMALQSYGWFTSPLRRYVDLCNQQQLVAFIGGTPLPFARPPNVNSSEKRTDNTLEKISQKINLFNQKENKRVSNALVHNELAEISQSANIYHGIYNEFQRKMERFWCLRFLNIQKREYYAVRPLRLPWVEFSEIPLHYKLTTEVGSNDELKLKVIEINEFTLEIKCAVIN